ncbi:serine hydrolase domain-containing protein [Streptomyces sp. 549]|uniref:serine hydrolase domain-containing protein n=1 Tax=Streptomyces sp. 549 TaxID=3049076 RepID=UPI0024C43EA1|nr:serine hydrolase domain-containing protein [Streptomyces sp. 549]MDK1475029.1 serine hydrolase domain-containing protein [Streptomyces sp. 549]
MTAPAHAPDPDPDPSTAAEPALLDGTRRALLHRLAVAQYEGRAPAAVAAVVRDGRRVWFGSRGAVDGEPATADTQFRIGSITKTFVAVLVLRLRDEGLLDLGDRLGTHLPTPQGGDATIAQLLSHSSGLAAEARGPWWERTPGELRPEPADLFGDEPQPHPAGRRFHYSNPGYALLGALVERLRGRPWHEVLHAEVLEPLGMSRTAPQPSAPHAEGWAVHPWADVVQRERVVQTGLMAPAGELWSTAGDLSRFAAFLAAGDERVLGTASLAEMRAPAVAPEPADWNGSYGLGLQVQHHDGRMLAGHGGSMPGFVAALWLDVEAGLGAVALANVTSGMPVAALATGLMAEVAEREPRLPGPWQPLDGVDTALLALTGPWYWGAAPYLLRLRGGGRVELSPMAGGRLGSRFEPVPGGGWKGLDGYFAGEPLRAVRRPDGTVDHLDLGTFVFTRQPYDPDAAVPGGTEGW